MSGGSKEFKTAEEAYLYAKIRAVEGFSPRVKKVGNSHVVTWRGQKKPIVESPDLAAESEQVNTGGADKFVKNYKTHEAALRHARSLAQKGLQPTVTGNNAKGFTVAWSVAWDVPDPTKTPSEKNKQEPHGSLTKKTGHIETKPNQNFNPIPIPSKGITTEGTPERKCVDCGNKIPSARIQQYPKAERCASCADKNAPPTKALPSSEIGDGAPPKLAEGFGGSREDWKKMRRGYLGDGRKGG